MINYEEILRDFQAQKVKYVLVGGMALNILGSLRNTADLDILVELSDRNLEKIVRILKKHGYAVKQPVDPMGIANKKIREDWINNKHMKVFNFYKDDDLQEVDIIIESPVLFPEAYKHAIPFIMEGIRIPVISIDHLIKMKKRAKRDVDLWDIKELKKIRRIRGQK